MMNFCIDTDLCNERSRIRSLFRTIYFPIDQQLAKNRHTWFV